MNTLKSLFVALPQPESAVATARSAGRAGRQRGACIVVMLSAAVLVLLGLGGVVDLAAHLLKSW